MHQEPIKTPMICRFFSAYPRDIYPADQDHINYSGLDLLQIEAALSKSPPTSVYTPGKTRPGGFNKKGQWKSAKYIPGKMDKRAGR